MGPHTHPPPAAPGHLTTAQAYALVGNEALLHTPNEWEAALASVLHYVQPAEVRATVGGSRVHFLVDANDASQAESIVADVTNPYFEAALGTAVGARITVIGAPVATYHSDGLVLT